MELPVDHPAYANCSKATPCNQSELSAALAPMPAPVRQKATLTFTDNQDGTLGVSMEFEPEVTDDTRSGAVHYAIKCMDHLSSLIGEG